MLRRECKVQSGNHIRANGVALNKSQKHTGKTFLFTHTKKKHTQNAGHRLKQQKTLTHRDIAKKKKNTILFYKTFNSWNLAKHFSMSAVSFFVSYCFRFKI